MKVLKTVLLTGAMSIALVGAASAADIIPEQFSSPSNSSWYLRGDVGWAFLDFGGGADGDDVTFGGGVGYQYNENLRADLRIDYAGDFDVGAGTELGFGTVLGNVYFDLPLGNQLTPYVGVGVGYGWADFQPGPTREGVAYAFMGGLSFNMTHNFAIDAGYRYRSVTVGGPDVSDHSLLAGVRYTF